MSGKFRRTAGYLLLAASAIAALAVFVLPFLDVSFTEGAVVVVALVILAEVAYFAGLALAGRDLWQRLKAQLEKLGKGESR